MELNVNNLDEVFWSSQEGDQAFFEHDGPTGGYSGYLIRNEFRGQSTSARQKHIWEKLRMSFGDQAGKVSIILAFTPEEWDEMHEDIASAS